MVIYICYWLSDYKRLTSRKRKSERSEVLTSTPVKDALLEKQKMLAEKEKSKELKKKLKFEKLNPGFTKEKKSVGKKLEKNKTASIKKKLLVKIAPHSTNISDEEGAADLKITGYECLVCGQSYDESWIQCRSCEEWAHEECADVTDDLYYYCDLCIGLN